MSIFVISVRVVAAGKAMRKKSKWGKVCNGRGPGRIFIRRQGKVSGRLASVFLRQERVSNIGGGTLPPHWGMHFRHFYFGLIERDGKIDHFLGERASVRETDHVL